MRMGGGLEITFEQPLSDLKKKICVNNWNQGNKIYLTLNCEEVHEWNNEKRQYV